MTNIEEIQNCSDPLDPKDKPKPVDDSNKPDWEDASTTPSVPVTIPKVPGSGEIKPGTTLEVAGPGKATVNQDGSITVVPNPGAKKGDTIVVTVKDPKGTTIDTVTVEIVQPKWDDKNVVPGGSVTIPNTGDKIPEGKTYTAEVQGPGKAVIDGDGNLIVRVNDDAKPGETVIVRVKDGDKVVDTVTITVDKPSGPDFGESTTPATPTTATATETTTVRETATATTTATATDGKDGRDGKDGKDGKDASSQLSDDCRDALLGWGIPLLALIPLGIAAQVAIPGLENIKRGIDEHLQAMNTQLQQQLGMLNPELAAQAKALNDAGNGLVGVLAGLGLLALGVTALMSILNKCVPGMGVPAPQGSGEGSSGSLRGSNNQKASKPAAPASPSAPAAPSISTTQSTPTTASAPTTATPSASEPTSASNGE